MKVSQPISQGNSSQGNSSQAAMTQSLSDTTSISQLPSYPSGNQMGGGQMPQQMPDYNNMNQQDQSNPASAGYESFSGGLMAANEALGGSFGSSF